MPLTRSFKETVLSRVQADPAFRDALLTEATQAMLEGDLATGKAVLRDYINATLGWAELAKAVDRPPTSLIRMFGPKGNPRADSLFSIISHLLKQTGGHLQVRVQR
jgi:DNA-binding phage protein